LIVEAYRDIKSPITIDTPFQQYAITSEHYVSDMGSVVLDNTHVLIPLLSSTSKVTLIQDDVSSNVVTFPDQLNANSIKTAVSNVTGISEDSISVDGNYDANGDGLADNWLVNLHQEAPPMTLEWEVERPNSSDVSSFSRQLSNPVTLLSQQIITVPAQFDEYLLSYGSSEAMRVAASDLIAVSEHVITAAATNANVMTLTLGSDHRLSVGDSISVVGLGFTTTDPNETFLINAITETAVSVELSGGDEVFIIDSNSVATARQPGNAFNLVSNLSVSVSVAVDPDNAGDNYSELHIVMPELDNYSAFTLTPVFQESAQALSNALVLSNAGLVKTIERLSASDTWVTERDGANDVIYDIDAITDTEGEQLTAFQTIEREVPRQILKDVWEIDENGKTVKTGAQDWFLDPRMINDVYTDQILIKGSDTANDRFIVGNEILNRDVTGLEEIQYDVLQVTHTKESADDDQVVIRLRSLTLDYEQSDSVINDQVTIDAGNGDNTILAGVVPNRPDVVEVNDIVQGRVVNQLYLSGGSGDDYIVGSSYTDVISMGEGVNRITGGKGVDQYIGGGSDDTLVEAFGTSDTTFVLSDASFAVTYEQLTTESRADGSIITVRNDVTDTEGSSAGIDLFENFYLYGGAFNDSFSIADFTANAVLDGTEGGDSYTITLSGGSDRPSNTRIVDSGQLSTDTDSVILQGSEQKDTLHLDVESSTTDYELNLRYYELDIAGNTATLSYDGINVQVDLESLATPEQKREYIKSQLESIDEITNAKVSGDGTDSSPYRISLVEVIDASKTLTAFSGGIVAINEADTATLSYNGADIAIDLAGISSLSAKRAHIESQIEAVNGIYDATVSGEGTSSRPYRISLVEVQDSSKLLTEISTSGAAVAGITTAFVQRLQDGVADRLLAGAPNVDAMFDAINKTQVFNRIQGSPADGEILQLSYNSVVQTFSYSAASALTYSEQLLQVLQEIDPQVELTGNGSEQDPWYIVFANADTDRQDNYYKLQLSGAAASNFLQPADLNDAVAQTRASGNLSASGTYQRVTYNYTAEQVSLHGRKGDDTFIADDTAAAVNVYGDQGNDSFLIGRVLKTTTVTVEGQQIQVVDETNDDGITAGVSYNARFYGGRGDDYFEVNHNVGELELFGESGDDTFFLKAHRTYNPDQQTTTEMAGGNISTGAGDDEGNVDEKDKDILLDYVENNRVEIYGGSGFDTIVIAGTALTDKFYIYTDNDGQQYLYGAGIKLDSIDGIERLALLTGAGDDEVWLYGLDKKLSLLLNLGSGSDQVHLGGTSQSFEVTYPAAAATYTVSKQVMQDVLQSTSITPDNINLLRRGLATDEKVKAFKDFYGKWFPDGDASKVEISDAHWSLLEANVATALFHFANAVRSTSSSSVKYYSADFTAYQARVGGIVDELLGVNNLSILNSGSSGRAGLYGALVAGTAPRMVDRLAIDGILDLMTGNSIWIDESRSGGFGLLSVDDLLYDEFLKVAVYKTILGDLIHGHTHGSNDIRGNAIYATQVQIPGRGNMPHITGVGDKTQLTKPIINNESGSDLLTDLLSLFYVVEAENDKLINITERWKAEEVAGLSSYRFDNLPQRTETRTLPANHDLSRVAGVVRIAGAGGDDTLSINAQSTVSGEALGVDISAKTLELGDFYFANDPVRWSEVLAAQQRIDAQNTGETPNSDDQTLLDNAETLQQNGIFLAYDADTIDSLIAALSAIDAGDASTYQETLVSNHQTYTTIDGIAISHSDVQDALLRSNKELNIGVLDQLLDPTNDLSSTSVTISVDREVPETPIHRTLQIELDGLLAAKQAIVKTEGTWWDTSDGSTETSTDGTIRKDWLNKITHFANRGLKLINQLPSETNLPDSASFSQVDLNNFINSPEFEFLKLNNGGNDGKFKGLNDAFNNLLSYLNLTVITADLERNGLTRIGESSLRVYQQVSPALMSTESIRVYEDDLWSQSAVDDGDLWISKEDKSEIGYYGYGFAGRLTVDYDKPLPGSNVGDGVNETPPALSVDGNTPPVLARISTTNLRSSGAATEITVDKIGSDVEILKSYVSQLGALDQSYYTNSYYTVDADGEKALSAVAIGRVNGDVAHSNLLEGEIYLTEANWIGYVTAVQQDATLALDEATAQSLLSGPFNDAAVSSLITNGFVQNQVLNESIPMPNGDAIAPGTGFTAPVEDGTRVKLDNGGERIGYFDIQTVKDSKNFYIPSEIILREAFDQSVNVSESYVIEKDPDTEYTVSYDSVSISQNGTAIGSGFWFNNIENIELEINGEPTNNSADIVDLDSTLHIDSILLDVGGGDNGVTFDNQTKLLNSISINSGNGTDTVDLNIQSNLLAINSADGNNRLTIVNSQDGSEAGITAGVGADQININTKGELNLTAGDGNNIITVVNDTVAGVNTINAGTGNDKVILTADGNTNIQAGDGVNHIEVANQNRSSNTDISTGSGDDVFKLNTKGDLSLISNAGDDRINVDTMFGRIALDAGAGNDSIALFDDATVETSIGDAGTLTVDGGANADTYIVSVLSQMQGVGFINLNDSGTDGIDTLTYKGNNSDVGDIIELDTIYDRTKDTVKEFSQSRWMGAYGNDGDGLLIAHFDDVSASYNVTDISDTDQLMETSASGLSEANNFLALNYSTIDLVTVFAGAGNDKVISNDTAQEINVFGGDGDDQFYVGSVLETEQFLVEGREVGIVTEVTHGSSYEMKMYGGSGDDYFEVSHTKADIELYGDNGDDTFFIKALLTIDEDEDIVELAGKSATVSGGTGDNSEANQKQNEALRELDIDTLVYVENANIKIDGGAGFDAIAIVGTVFSDTFYVFSEVDEITKKTVQRVYGAGIKLQEALNTERIQIITGAGDDKVYVYGVDMGRVGDLLINTGTGSDEIYFGGPSLTVSLNYPTRKRTDFSSVSGFESAGELDVAYGQGIEQTDEVGRVVAVNISEPSYTETLTIEAVESIGNIFNPVLITDPEGLKDILIINNQNGSGDVTLKNHDLLRKTIITDQEKIVFPAEVTVAAETDLVAQFETIPAQNSAAVKGMIDSYLQNQITFDDKYSDYDVLEDGQLELGLINRLTALEGSQVEVISIAAAVPYAVFQDKLGDYNQIDTARGQLDDFLSGTGYQAQYLIQDHPDPSLSKNLYELVSISNGVNTLAFEGQYKEINFDNRVIKDLIGVSLTTANPIALEIQAGYIQADDVAIERTDHLNTLSINDEAPNIYFQQFEKLDLNLASNISNDLTIDNSHFTGTTTVRSGQEGDNFNLQSINEQVFIYAGAGDDVFTIADGDVSLINDQVFIFGQDGQDTVVVNNQSDTEGANVLLDSNMVQHSLIQEKLSKVTNALEFTIDNSTDQGALENQLIGSELTVESIQFAQAAASVGADQLKAIAIQSAKNAGADLKAILESEKSSFDALVGELTGDQQAITSGYLEDSLVNYYEAQKAYNNGLAEAGRLKDEIDTKARRAVSSVFDMWSLWKDQVTNNIKAWLNTHRSGWRGYSVYLQVGNREAIDGKDILDGYSGGDTLTLNLSMRMYSSGTQYGYRDSEGSQRPIDQLLPNAPYNIPISSALRAKIAEIESLKAESQVLQQNVELLGVQAQSAMKPLQSYHTNQAGVVKSLSKGEISSFYDAALERRNGAISARNFIDNNQGVQNTLSEIALEITNNSQATMQFFDNVISAAEILRTTSSSVAGEILSFNNSLQALKTHLADDSASSNKWERWIDLKRTQLLPQLTLAEQSQTLEDVESLWNAILVNQGFDRAGLFNNVQDPNWQQSLDLFNDNAFKGLIDLYDKAQLLAQNFSDYRSDRFSDFRSAYRNMLKFETSKRYLENGFEFEVFKADYKSNVEQLDAVADLLDTLVLVEKYTAQLASLNSDKEIVLNINEHNSSVVAFFEERVDAAIGERNTLENQLRGEYRVTLEFFYGYSFSIDMDFSQDSRFLAAQGKVQLAQENLLDARAKSARAQNHLSDLNKIIAQLEGDLQAAESQTQSSGTNLEELKETLDQQYKFLRNLSRVAVNVLSETRINAAEEFDDSTSLIAEIRKYQNTYEIASGAVVPANDNGLFESNVFSPGETGNSIVSTRQAWDSFSVLSVMGLNNGGLHLAPDDIESLIINLGDQSDKISVYNSLSQLNSEVKIVSGQGDDQFDVGEQRSLDGIVATLVIESASGETRLKIDDFAETDAENISMTNASRTGYTSLIGLAVGDIHYRGADYTAGIEVQAGQNADTILVDGILANSVNSILAGAGNDDITFTAASQINASVTIIGEQGGDLIDGAQSGLKLRIEGNQGADTIYGSVFDDTIFGHAGNDFILGNFGADNISGDDGDDLILGDWGRALDASDQVYLPRNNDVLASLQTLNGGAGDEINGGLGDDTIIGGAGSDLISDEDNNTVAIGDNGKINYDLTGVMTSIRSTSTDQGGDDQIEVGDGNNTIIGGFGNDKITTGSGSDDIFGDNGVIDYVNGDAVRLSTNDDEIATTGADEIDGGSGDNRILAGLSNDQVTTLGGVDVVLGDNGQLTYVDNVLTNAASTETALGDIDNIDAGEGDNIVIAGQGADVVTTGSGTDTVIGDNGEINYDLAGVMTSIRSTSTDQGGDDQLEVGDGNNTIIGGFGNDKITTGSGSDDILGDNGVIEYVNGDAVRLSTNDDEIATTGADEIVGGSGDNRILAGLSNDQVTTLDGVDVVLGDNGQLTYVNNILTKAVSSESALGGMDTLTVGDGDNTVIGGQEADSITGGEGHDRVIGDNGEIVYGSLGVIETIESTVISEGASDIIKVGNGDNTVIGGQGSDEITAGTGNDDILGDNGVITYSNGIAIRIATSDEDENTGGGDTINAGEGDNRILAGLSGDGVTALGGDDVVLGDNGEINYDLAGVIVSIHTHAADKSGNDIIVIDSGNNRILAGAGDDSVTTGAGDDVVIADSGRIDFAEGLMQTVFADHIETGKDYLLLGSGNNIAAGGDGDDTVVADAGDDWIVGDSGTFTLESGVVKHFVHTDESTGFDNLMSGEGRDVLIGGHGADTLDGQAGNDMVIGDFVEIKVGDDGSRDMQSILPTIGGDDSITGGDDFDILVGGAGTDMFFGNLSEDIIVGNYARIQDVPDSEALLVVSDPSNREVISSSMLEVYADEPAASEAAENRTFTADYSLITDDPAATKPLQADTALRLTPLLDGRDFKQMSDTELAEFLRNLPLVSAETSSSDGGVRSSEASQVTPENGELPVEESEAQKPGATEQLFEQETSAPLESKDNDASIESSGNTDLSAEMLASLLIAAKASRKRGWQLAGSEQNQGTIDGNLSDLREVQSERQFKPWHRH